MNLELQREWLEGLGKYTKLAIWKLAGFDSTYHPVKDLLSDHDFSGYKSFNQHWVQEISTLRFQPQGEENRFYYAGMAQAFVLDQLFPDWKKKVFQDNIFLEDLLKNVISGKAL